ncbi:porin family protein [Fulvivirga sediminis]|uniref:PorT family protein n=1 Tax=Fulvivirga sediminis TaxID=2803949 RepID=A0A937JZ73_9BACT|nr:porin family protein [Fulvivirga sediminis]MBL3657128.1 PorT family protein [Fulvivirga sediminis]
MKKITLLGLFCLMSVVGLHAQGIGLGIKGGANFANVDVGSVDTDNKTGYHFGAFLDLGLNDNISIQPEVLYSAQGADDFDLDYLTIPVLLKLKFLKVLNVHAGPQFGILTNAEDDGEDVKDRLKSADVSLALGAGVDLPLGLVGGVRYNLGVSDIDDGYNVDIKNRVMQIYVGWKLF